jgi:hypothetical protein
MAMAADSITTDTMGDMDTQNRKINAPLIAREMEISARRTIGPSK